MRSKTKIKTNYVNKNATVFDRSLRITKSLVGKRFSIYNGQNFISLLIREHHIGYRFGQFIKTKRRGGAIHATKDSKKNKNKNKK